uniref:DUF3456 domain-containing protein n=1 Tax=Syphacia muris TaxID=451379 RepID=A0A0N5ADE1_9BILA
MFVRHCDRQRQLRSVCFIACSLVITELESGIASVGSNKKIQVGSFRVNPNGNQEGLSSIPYARSEAHIHELLDSICDKSNQYVLAVHPTTGKSVYVRKDKTSSDGDNSKFTLAKLNHACSDFLDDYEDDVVKFIREKHADPVREFCHTRIGEKFFLV